MAIIILWVIVSGMVVVSYIIGHEVGFRKGQEVGTWEGLKFQHKEEKGNRG